MTPYARIIYATPEDLPKNLQHLDDVQQRVQAASDLVAWLIGNARYDTGDDGYPSDPDLLALLVEATVTQVVFNDNQYGGADGPGAQAPASIGTLKFGAENDSSGRNPNYGTRVHQHVSPATWYMLRNAGLIHGVIR